MNNLTLSLSRSLNPLFPPFFSRQPPLLYEEGRVGKGRGGVGVNLGPFFSPSGTDRRGIRPTSGLEMKKIKHILPPPPSPLSSLQILCSHATTQLSRHRNTFSRSGPPELPFLRQRGGWGGKGGGFVIFFLSSHLCSETAPSSRDGGTERGETPYFYYP